MCGIAGVFGPGITKNDLNVFYQLMFLNQLRGMHSTGVARIFHKHSNKNPDIRKDVVPAFEFFDRGEQNVVFEDVTPIAIMGHCRHATVGAADNILGAHPFENDKYIGFHNGTLKDNKYTTESGFFTDSEALYADMAEHSPNDVLPIMEKDSAFALAFFDKEAHRINFVRNEHRPLAFAVNANRSVVYYSSEKGMLDMVLDRCGVNFYSYNLKTWALASVDPGNINFNDEEVKKDKNIKRTNYWAVDELVPKPPVQPIVHSHRSGIKNWWQNYYDDDQSTSISSSSTSSKHRECANCNSALVYHSGKGKEIKDKNPKLIEDFGIVCADCYDNFQHGKYIDGDGKLVLTQ